MATYERARFAGLSKPKAYNPRKCIACDVAQITECVMNHELAVSNAKEIADRVLAPRPGRTTRKAGSRSEAVEALGRAGLLGLMLPAEVGGAALGPRTFAAVIAALAEADASVAMVYLMHVCAAATIAAARPAPPSRRH